jgi:mono/diheme cytochrome c family protein
MRQILSRLALAAFFIGFSTLVLPAETRAQGEASKVFKTNCVLCHAANGSGDSPAGKAMSAKDLRSAEVQKESDADLTATITKGRGKMPAFGQKLSPDVITSLAAYIRQLPKK